MNSFVTFFTLEIYALKNSLIFFRLFENLRINDTMNEFIVVTEHFGSLLDRNHFRTVWEKKTGYNMYPNYWWPINRKLVECQLISILTDYMVVKKKELHIKADNNRLNSKCGTSNITINHNWNKNFENCYLVSNDLVVRIL